MKETCLITGVAGFIGSNLTQALLEKGYRVIGVDNLLTGNKFKIKEFLDNENFEFYEDDVNNYNKISSIFFNNKIDYVFHYAAVVGVQLTLNNPEWVFKDIQGFKNILDLSRHAKVKRIFYSSSSEVYGEAKQLPMEENNTPLNSRLPYAIVKNLGESYFKTYYEKYGLNYTIIRLFNTYGPKQSKNFVVSKFINQALSNQDITIYGDGNQTRTFFFVKDHVNFVTSLLDNEESINQTINLGGEDEITMNELANSIIKLTGSDSKITNFPPLKEGDMSRRKPDIVKMNSFLNNMERTDFKDGLKKTIDYFKNLKNEKLKDL